jgi:hypothetical protein
LRGDSHGAERRARHPSLSRSCRNHASSQHSHRRRRRVFVIGCRRDGPSVRAAADFGKAGGRVTRSFAREVIRRARTQPSAASSRRCRAANALARASIAGRLADHAGPPASVTHWNSSRSKAHAQFGYDVRATVATQRCNHPHGSPRAPGRSRRGLQRGDGSGRRRFRDAAAPARFHRRRRAARTRG